MKYFFNRHDKYEKILKLLCEYKGIKKEEAFKILNDNECKCILFLLLKKYNCMENIDILKKDLFINEKNQLDYNLKEAKKKLLINRKIREMYFEAKDLIENAK